MISLRPDLSFSWHKYTSLKSLKTWILQTLNELKGQVIYFCLEYFLFQTY